MVELINVPYSHQDEDGYCLPACAQMALAHLGISRSQRELARQLGMVQDFGVPASQILKLRTRQIDVIYHTEGEIADIHHWLALRVPVIACVQTSHLAYWKGHLAQHAVLVVGIDEHLIYLFDPGWNESVVAVSIDEFWLAWDEMALAYGVIHRR